MSDSVWPHRWQPPGSPSLGFSRQEQWSGLPFPSPMHESEKSKWSRLVVSYSSRPNGPQPTRLLCPWDFPGKSTGVGCHCLLHLTSLLLNLKWSPWQLFYIDLSFLQIMPLPLYFVPFSRGRKQMQFFEPAMHLHCLCFGICSLCWNILIYPIKEIPIYSLNLILASLPC